MPRYDNLIWMKLSEIARYWAARELTRVDRDGDRIRFFAPFACPGFTVRLKARPDVVPKLSVKDSSIPLTEVTILENLKRDAWHRQGEDMVVCFDLPKGQSTVLLRSHHDGARSPCVSSRVYS